MQVRQHLPERKRRKSIFVHPDGFELPTYRSQVGCPNHSTNVGLDEQFKNSSVWVGLYTTVISQP